MMATSRKKWLQERIGELCAEIAEGSKDDRTISQTALDELKWLQGQVQICIQEEQPVGVVAIAGEGLRAGDIVNINKEGKAHRFVIHTNMLNDNISNSKPSVNLMQKQVREFMEKMDQMRGDTIAMRDHMLRFRLIWEEAHELCNAILAEDLEKSVDGMCDLLYVVFGTAVAFGINLQPYFDEVHRTNMLKEKDVKDRWGKIIKPEGWQPPRILEMLMEDMVPQHEQRIQDTLKEFVKKSPPTMGKL